MRVAVIGAGGVGGYFGGRLAASGVHTTFIARGATLEALRTRGLRVDSINGDFAIEHLAATDEPSSIGIVDAVLFAVKAWQIPEAAEAIRPLVGPETIVVPLENGMEAPEQLARVLPDANILGGLCGIVSYIVEPGHIRHSGAEPFVMFGALNPGRSAAAERLRDLFIAAGVKADIPPDINRSMWTKFLFIAPMSGVGAATRAPVGVWRTIPETRELAMRAIDEVLAVANARGVTLAEDAAAQTLARFDALPAESTSSLQRDVMEGKPSELDAQLGAVVRMAEAAGIAVPVCTALYRLLLPQERVARGEA
ncbi:MAG: 2-dehydropantoate 2-reductase [Acidobacteriota bacterium]|jgi:2-dehydropantoate 2-reductase|nr:2-dehydropantoate 2-reductase [Acidobacteriota bacterium]